METFIAAATRIADGIDLDEFVAPSSPPPEEWKTFMLHFKFASECRVDL